jgi:NADH:ubiquinone oxidoreductase subunit 5 (subunit L)/multisubunit Na+/H+ antiporter MnhA subunit
VGVLTAVMTAYYMFRLYFLTFEGEHRGPEWWADFRRSKGEVVTVPPVYVPPVPAGRHAHVAHVHEDGHTHDHAAHAGPGMPAPLGAAPTSRSSLSAEPMAHEAEGSHGHDVLHDAHDHTGLMSGESSPHGSDHHGPADGNWTMNVPLVILGLFAILGGFIALAFAGGAFGGLIHASDATQGAVAATAETAQGGVVNALVAPFFEWTTYLSILAAVVGIVVAWMMWGPGKAEANITVDSETTGIARVWQKRYYIDQLYDTVFGRWVLRQADSQNDFDAEVVDGAVNGIATVNDRASGRIRRWNTGNVQDYALTMLFGFIVIVLIVIYVPQLPDIWDRIKGLFPGFLFGGI